MLEPARARNLLFLFSDQHAQRVAGCYGDVVVATPNLDRLAARGVTFDNAYTPSPVCVPARMSMLTGLHPHQQECWTNDDILSSELPTWPQSLGAAGVHTALIGRMHAMGPDQRRGYAEREIGDHSPNWPGLPRHDLGPLARANDPHRISVENSGAGQNAYQALDEATTSAACAWLVRWAAGAARPNGHDRFALTVGLMLPHAPYVAQKQDFARYDGRIGPPVLGPPADEHAWFHWWRQSRGILDVPLETTMRARAAYYALVTRLDSMVGQILATLEATGLADDTLIVYSSDHGDHIGERGLWWKHTLYDDAAKVPLILSYPGHLPQSRRCAAVVNLQDVAATMLDVMGAPPLPASNGRSFRAVAEGTSRHWDDVTLSEYCTDSVPEWTGGMAVRQRMVRERRWKLIVYHGYPPQLFDLEADPRETNDLAAVAAHATVLERLRERAHKGWDPKEIGSRMAWRRRNKDLQAAWARSVRPDDILRFVTTPDMNWLDQDGRRQGPA